MCWVQEPGRNKAAAAPWPQIQPVARLRTYFQQSHQHTQHIWYVHTSVHVSTSSEWHSRSAECSHKYRNYHWLCPVPLSGWSGWRSISENICIAEMQWGSFQQLDLGTQLTVDPGLPNCWNLEAWTPKATAYYNPRCRSFSPSSHPHSRSGWPRHSPAHGPGSLCSPHHFPQSLFYTQMSLSDSSRCHSLYSSSPGLPAPALSLQDSALPVLSPGSQATSPTCQLVQCALR